MNSLTEPGIEYQLQSDDSSVAAERAQFEAWARMDDAAKVGAVRCLISRAAKLQRQGLRDLYPKADERELFLRAAAIRLGSASVRRWTGFDAELS